MLLQRLALWNLQRRPQPVFRTGDLAVGRTGNDVAAERIFLEHEIERGVELLCRHLPGDERPVGELGSQQGLAHPADHTGLQHRADPFEHRLQLDARSFGYLGERRALEATHHILRNT